MLVVLDEAHHLGEELAWGTASNGVRRRAARLLLSGTPFRSDATPIPGVRYDAEAWRPRRLLHLRRGGSRRDLPPGGVRDVRRHALVAQRRGCIESSFETVLTAREASRRYRTAISTELPDGLPRILREADAKLRALRAEGHRDAGGSP